MELTSAQMEAAKRDVRQGDEEVAQLLELLQQARRHRDEAREQLRLLNSLSQNHQSTAVGYDHDLGSSIVPHCAGGLDSNLGFHNSWSSSSSSTTTSDGEFDRGMAVIDLLAATRTLPERGRLLEAMIAAPPPLKSLLLIGTLPRWRNPPRWMCTVKRSPETFDILGGRCQAWR